MVSEAPPFPLWSGVSRHKPFWKPQCKLRHTPSLFAPPQRSFSAICFVMETSQEGGEAGEELARSRLRCSLRAALAARTAPLRVRGIPCHLGQSLVAHFRDSDPGKPLWLTRDLLTDPIDRPYMLSLRQRKGRGRVRV
jgi:hypothetical protein